MSRLLQVSCVAVIAGGAQGQIVNGFVEGFASGTSGFDAFGMSVTNPGTGGVGGAGDGFLSIARATPGRFAARSIGKDYGGDYIAAGVTEIRFALRDINAPDVGMEIRLGIGNTNNFWVSNDSWLPGAAWQVFSADLGDAGAWTPVIGSGTFENALRSADRLQFRHETLPVDDGMAADDFAGDVGVDDIAFLPAPGALALALGSVPLAWRRRR